MAASRRQQAANQANAQQSTGPQTPEGKAQSAQNSLKHGLTAQGLVVDGESVEEFEVFCQDWEASVQPQDAREKTLLEQIISHAWRWRRCGRAEAAAIQTARRRISGLSDGAMWDQVLVGHALIKALPRYETALNNGFHRALKALDAYRRSPAKAEAAIERPAESVGR